MTPRQCDMALTQYRLTCRVCLCTRTVNYRLHAIEHQRLSPREGFRGVNNPDCFYTAVHLGWLARTTPSEATRRFTAGKHLATITSNSPEHDSRSDRSTVCLYYCGPLSPWRLFTEAASPCLVSYTQNRLQSPSGVLTFTRILS
ncbi:hypothetical protein J6590_031462 [Homalodisca vitripennis]|nr:hypothetical protein J6590_031462 [Homalodisca vitripennis]